MTPAGFLLVLVCAGAGALLQGLTGFGASLVMAPALFAALPPADAVVLAAGLGIVQGSSMAVRGRRDLVWPELRRLSWLAPPGLLCGALILREAPADGLRVGVGVAVLVATAATRLAGPRRLASPRLAAPAGFLAGALTTSVTVNGPPLVLYLGARRATAAQLRATLAAAFVALDVVAVAALGVTGSLVVPPAASVLALALAIPFGLGLAGRLAPRIDEARHAAATTLLLAALGTASIVAGVH